MTAEIREVVSAQHRRRRMIFWLGFLAILAVGALWAGLSKDPLGPDFFEGEFGLRSAKLGLTATFGSTVQMAPAS